MPPATIASNRRPSARRGLQKAAGAWTPWVPVWTVMLALRARTQAHSLAGSGSRRPISRLTEAALRTAELIRKEAEIARQQADRRADASRAVAGAELEEARLQRDPIHAAPREQRVKLLEDVARLIDGEAEVLDREADQLLSQARTAEQRAYGNGG